MHKPFAIFTLSRWARQDRFRSFLRVLLLATLLFSGGVDAVTATVADTDTVAQVAREIDARLDEMAKMSADDVAVRAKTQESLLSLLQALEQRTVMIFGERRRRWQAILTQMRVEAATWSNAATSRDSPAAAAALGTMRKDWSAIKLLYPREALDILPGLWSCPMHIELMEPAAGICPVCGMSLEPIYATQPQLTRGPIIQAQIAVNKPLVVGQEAEIRIQLFFNKDNKPVSLDDLEELHTRKIHLLINDRSLTDYHHEHPEPVGKGEFLFRFTPAKTGIYRVWADLKPLPTHIQQYSIADIPALSDSEERRSDEAENRHTEIEGYNFDLTFDKPLIQEKDVVAGKLFVSRKDDQGKVALQVVMGAFGHFVGFQEDFSTVMHIHPLGPSPESPDSTGPPELPFYFRSDAPGLVRLFTQVRIDGKDFFPRFIVKVQPLRRLPR